MFLKRFFYYSLHGVLLLLFSIVVFGTILLLQSKIYIFSISQPSSSEEEIIPFPVSVNSHTKTIEETIFNEHYLNNFLAANPSQNPKKSWLNKIAAIFSKNEIYQNLATPVSRILIIWPGERKEEIIKNIGDILNWNQSDRLKFEQLNTNNPLPFSEGIYLPDSYITHTEATPEEVYQLISENFHNKILLRYTPEVIAHVPLKDALIIASLVEREASDFDNMREVSGVIWNRLFIDMPLQLDASLQYIRGSDLNEPKWWPVARPQDKFLKSSYNTYQNKGLPPTPIANPSIEAILATLNPIITDCIFYFHGRNKDYHCSSTYEEHVKKLRAVYGRGS